MSDPICQFCGETMKVCTPFYDKFSGRYTAHAKCWACGAQGPMAKGYAPQAITNMAKKNVLNRPRQIPLRWVSLDKQMVVWLEDVDKRDVIPAFPEPRIDNETMTFLTYDQEFVHTTKADYSKRWRAWAVQPTSKERKEAPWAKA